MRGKYILKKLKIVYLLESRTRKAGRYNPSPAPLSRRLRREMPARRGGHSGGRTGAAAAAPPRTRAAGPRSARCLGALCRPAGAALSVAGRSVRLPPRPGHRSRPSCPGDTGQKGDKVHAPGWAIPWLWLKASLIPYTPEI